nr:DUF4920 domain-containing protein [Cytophagales bacterium]
MKSVSLFFLLVTAFFGCKPHVSEMSALKNEEQTIGYYGEKITSDEAVSPGEMLSELDISGAFEGKVRGEIKEVCTKKGCWMTISLPDGKLMRVTFKDYGFFIPTDAHGNQVVMMGKASKSVTDVAELRHYAEDAGKPQEEIDAITAAEESFSFEATGVLISSSN